MLVHGNIKASNIFLNQQLYSCVSYFLFSNMTKTRLISTSSDVYSFGILLLQLLTRKTPAAVNLVKLVNSVKTKERAANVFDPDLLKHPSISEQMIKMLQIGIRCVANSAKKRPKISEVVEMLVDIDISSRVSPSLDSMSQEGKLVFLEDVNVGPVFEIEYLLEASAEVIGKGSFGTSYRTILDNGSIVVVKRFKDVNPTFKDFHKHVELFGRLNHMNIGRLKAYYYGRDKMLLLYDYYRQGCISSLHGKRSDGVIPLDWVTRVKVALEAARGIAHVHGQDQKLVLGNIKSSNIFINDQNHTIVAFDAGLANLISPERLPRVLDSVYCAPEVASSGEVSQASDVYSFGVVLLELFYGVSSQVFSSLPELVRYVNHTHDWPAELVDGAFLRYRDKQALAQALQMAAGCVGTVVEHRPTIFEVVKVLEEINGVDCSSVQSRLESLLENLLPMLSPVAGHQELRIEERSSRLWKRAVGVDKESLIQRRKGRILLRVMVCVCLQLYFLVCTVILPPFTIRVLFDLSTNFMKWKEKWVK
ncbi:probable inactive receptor kinase At2g26730 isoform X1 [Salvia splendens]|uniref:probable inactive receptor kinase At2g26730 isoform X1 n=1 Tax=Salvia splendens TaxID=180675 RepID=UPI001C2718DF|nr:probable inactive receptor kinase At2g26730 isoform X1 [Salvia splendens]